MSEIVFVDGLRAFRPNDNAPAHIKARLNINRVEMIAWLNKQAADEVRVEVCESKGGKYYARLDTWKPDQSRQRPAAQTEQAPWERPAQQPSAQAAAKPDDFPF